MRKTNEESLSAVITRLIDTYRLKDGLESVRVRECWAHTMEAAIIHRTVKVSFKNGVLRVQLNSAVLRQELASRPDDVCEKMNEALGEKLITHVEFC